MMLDWAERVGFRVPDNLVFGRTGQVGYFPRGFRRDHEPLLWLIRPGADAWMDVRALAEKAARVKRVGQQTTHRNRDGSLTIQKVSGFCVENGLRLRGSLWDYGQVGASTGAPDIEDQNHPARWPYRLARDIVVCFCPPGGLVVDPFVGAGTTAAAAIGEGRRFIGGDLGQRDRDGMPWATVAHGVLTERNRQVSLFGGAG
jgi:site-specific DNA-methyltransferase (adenine-specific)